MHMIFVIEHIYGGLVDLLITTNPKWEVLTGPDEEKDLRIYGSTLVKF